MSEPGPNAAEERGVPASNAVGRFQIRGAPLVGDDFSVFAGSLANLVVLLVSASALASVQLGKSSNGKRVPRRSCRLSIFWRICWLRRLRSI